MKKITSNKKGARLRTNLANIRGQKEHGFYEGCLCELSDMLLRDGALVLRGGIKKLCSLGSDITLAQSVSLGGVRHSFVSDSSAVYSLSLSGTGEATLTPVFDSGMRAPSDFIFSAGANIFAYKDRQFYILGEDGFSVAPICYDSVLSTSLEVPSDELYEKTNLLLGGANIEIIFPEMSNIVSLEDEVYDITSATLDEESILHMISYKGGGIAIPTTANVGSSLKLTVITDKIAAALGPSGLTIDGCASSDTGECYAYNDSHIFKLLNKNGSLFLTMPIFESSAKSIRSCLICAGMPAAAVGFSIGLVKDGGLDTLECERVADKNAICSGGGGLFFDNGHEIVRLKITGSAYSTETAIEREGGYKSEDFITEMMVYSEGDKRIYSPVKRISDGKRLLICADTQSGVCSYITPFASPSFCFMTEEGLCVADGCSLFLMSDDERCDSDGEVTSKIEGRVLFCPSRFGEDCERKRLLSASASLGGEVESLTLTVRADNRRQDSLTYTRKDADSSRAAVVSRRMNVGVFSHADAEAIVKGYAGDSLHDLFFDLKICK